MQILLIEPDRAQVASVMLRSSLHRWRGPINESTVDRIMKVALSILCSFPFVDSLPSILLYLRSKFCCSLHSRMATRALTSSSKSSLETSICRYFESNQRIYFVVYCTGCAMEDDRSQFFKTYGYKIIWGGYQDSGEVLDYLRR